MREELISKAIERLNGLHKFIEGVWDENKKRLANAPANAKSYVKNENDMIVNYWAGLKHGEEDMICTLLDVELVWDEALGSYKIV